MRKEALIVAAFALASLAAAARSNAGGFPTFGVTYGAPSSLAGFVKETIGVGKGERSAISLQGQAGLGGGELAVGGGRYLGREGITLLSVSAVAARTWGSPRGIDPGRTLVGGRLECTIAFILSTHVGVLYPVGDAQPRSARLTWGIGLGIPILFKGPLIGPMTE